MSPLSTLLTFCMRHILETKRKIRDVNSDSLASGIDKTSKLQGALYERPQTITAGLR
jgi:hypothetical protein